MPKIPNHINEKLKEAVRSVRKRGEEVEVFWYSKDGNDWGEPWDQDLHGAWFGDLVGIHTLREWIRKNGADTRSITIYCRGDDVEIRLIEKEKCDLKPSCSIR